MITIDISDGLSSAAIDFVKQEWEKADVIHFGRKIVWKKEKMVLQAVEDSTVVGVLELTMQAGVMYIDELIVKQDRQGSGIGTMLMKKAEEIAKEKKLHKIHLDTGKTWEATKFYEKLGYQKTGNLLNHFENADYIIYSKFL